MIHDQAEKLMLSQSRGLIEPESVTFYHQVTPGARINQKKKKFGMRMRLLNHETRVAHSVYALWSVEAKWKNEKILNKSCGIEAVESIFADSGFGQDFFSATWIENFKRRLDAARTRRNAFSAPGPAAGQTARQTALGI